MNIIKEFKEFAIKGNMFDMAIGIIIGTGFNKIVSSLVNDLILPSLSLLIGQVNFQNLSLVLRDKQVDSTGVVIQELVAIKYGNFLQVLVDFTIIALSAFLVIKLFNSFRKKAEDVKDVTVSTPKDIELLSEIRDLLKVKG